MNAAAMRMAVLVLAGLSATPALAAEALPGAQMSLWWALPFAGLLLCIATGPLLFHHFWEHHYGKIAAVWAALVIVPLAASYGVAAAGEAVLHAMLLEYMSFIILLFALFTISGGILISGNIHGTPLFNAGLLLVGSILASVIGTTGASMIQKIRETVLALRHRGVSTILVEQRAEAVLALADRVTFIENGHSRETVAIAELKADPSALRRYVGIG